MSAALAEDVPTRLFQRAVALEQAGRGGESCAILERLRSLPAPPAGFHALEARVMARMGRHQQAEEAASAALEQGAEAAPLLALRAQARLAQGNLTGGLDDAAQLVMAQPGDGPAQALLGDALLRAERFDEAIFLHGRLFQQAPEDPNAILRLARSFLRAGRHAPAEELLALAEQRLPNVASVAALRAQNQLLAGNAARAEALAEAALARGQVDASVHSVLAHALATQQRMAEAGRHFIAAARLAPHDEYHAHLAASVLGTETSRATPGYVASLFDGYAANFDDQLIGLGYRVPGLVRQAVEAWLPGAPAEGGVLDLGCGTGLVAVALMGLDLPAPVGVDLSPGMLRQAAAKGLYATLCQTDIITHMQACPEPQRLIIAADVFCYLGDLAPLVHCLGMHVMPGGALVFSVEQGAEATPWHLQPSGRYCHGRAPLQHLLAEAGFGRVTMQETPLRQEAGQDIPGLFVVAMH